MLAVLYNEIIKRWGRDSTELSEIFQWREVSANGKGGTGRVGPEQFNTPVVAVERKHDPDSGSWVSLKFHLDKHG